MIIEIYRCPDCMLAIPVKISSNGRNRKIAVNHCVCCRTDLSYEELKENAHPVKTWRVRMTDCKVKKSHVVIKLRGQETRSCEVQNMIHTKSGVVFSTAQQEIRNAEIVSKLYNSMAP